MLRLLPLLLALCLPAVGQLIQLDGGQSTLMNGAGGAVTAYLPNQTAMLGAGFANGHFVFSAADTFQFHNYQMTVGDSSFGYSVDNIGGAGLQSRGIAISRVLPDSTIAAFAGMAGAGYQFPFLSAVDARNAGAGIFYHRVVHRWQFSSLAAFSGGKRTALQSAAFTAGQIHFVAGGGVLAGTKTSSALFDFRANQHLDFTATRQDLFWNGQRATVNSVGGFGMVGRFTFNATALEGTSNGHHISGQQLGAGIQFGAISVRGNIYQSDHTTMFTQSVFENYRHWHFSQSLSEVAGHPSFSFGGGYTSNRLTVSIDHNVAFLPFGSGFTQVTSISLSFRLPRTDTHVNLAATLLPTGPVYTASASSFVQGPLKGSTLPSAPHQEHHSTGKNLLRGVVLDKSGKPVYGAAIQLGREVVYSDAEGHFVFRARKATPLAVRVAVEQFAAPGTWAAESVPATIAPGPDAVLIVRRIQ